MKNIFLFDVDGTITPARQEMTQTFYLFFRKWIEDKKVYLISGSDYEKLQQQIPKDILESIDGVFGCMGNTFHTRGQNIFENIFEPPPILLSFLEERITTTIYDVKTGNHIEKRIGMINFSVVGRNASLEQRKHYYKFDCLHGEREKIASVINKKFNGIEASLGGEISIDIYPVGWDKSQILKHLPNSTYHFFGDKIYPGGNDYALAKKLDNKKNMVYSVKSYLETKKILKKI